MFTDRGMCKALREVIASHMAGGACRVSAHEASSLVMEIPRVLTAVIALASTGVPEAVHVAVMSPAEVASGRSHWAGSLHQVFRCDSSSRVNAHHSVMHLLASQGMPIAGARNPLCLHTAMLAGPFCWRCEPEGASSCACEEKFTISEDTHGSGLMCRRVSDVALHALRHFTESAQRSERDSIAEAKHDGAQNAEALQSLLLWLASYR